MGQPRKERRKQYSTYRTGVGVVETRATSLVWLFVLPAAAVLTTDVWFPQIIVGGVDLQLAVINIAGAFMEGFFAAWESGSVKPGGAVTGMLRHVADDMRAFFLSTFTSWAGMVGFAAVLAHQQDSVLVGLTYMTSCVALAFLANNVGLQMALLCSSNTRGTSEGDIYFASSNARGTTFESSHLTHALLVVIVAYITATYTLVVTDAREFSEAFLPHGTGIEESSLIAFLDLDHSHIQIAMVCSIAGAFTGNLVGNLIDSWYDRPNIPRGTLVCNTLFAFSALLLPAMTLREANFQHSVLLQSFVGSFCGAASAFAGHSSDATELYQKSGTVRALENSIANLFCSFWVFLIALEMECLLKDVVNVDSNADGIVDLREIAMYHGYLVGKPTSLSKWVYGSEL